MGTYLSLAEPRSGQRHEFTTTPVRIGRDPEFELVITGDGAAVVSGSHAVLEHDGATWALTDLGSRNGTWLNGTRLAANVRTTLAAGAVLQLGESGPQFRVVATAPRNVAATMIERAVPRPVAPSEKPPLVSTATPVAPSPGSGSAGPGMRTLGFERALRDEQTKSVNRQRSVLAAASVLVFAIVIAAAAFIRLQRVRQEDALAGREAEVAHQALVNDSLRLLVSAEADQLRARLTAAESAGGNVGLVDSLSRALASANARSAELESSLQRAERAVVEQQHAADSTRTAAQSEIVRLKDALAKADGGKGAMAGRERDSLRKRLDVVQAKATEASQLDAKVKASGANLAQLAQANGAAIGIVTGWFGTKARSATGVVVTASGVMITARDVLRDGDTEADSIEVSLGGTRKSVWAGELAVPDAGGADIGLIQIDEYAGPFVKKVDWKGTSLREGETTALIGMPAGLVAGTVARPIIAAGVLGVVAADQVAYDATTAVGGNGSALFNAAGELVAVHAGKGATGYVATPLKPVRKLLPDEVRKELGF